MAITVNGAPAAVLQVSADLAATISDESGTGAVVFNLAPSLRNVTMTSDGTNAGNIVLNCTSNSHGQKLAAQAHAQAATNTLLLPGGTTIGNGDSTLVSEIGTQTLTNKTLTSPTIGTSASLSNQGEIRFVEATANGSNYVGFKAPSSIASNLIFTLPSGDGTSNQVLQTDGSGVLSFATASSGTTADDQAFAFAVQVFA